MTAMLAPRTGLIGRPMLNGLALPEDLTFDEWRGVIDYSDMIVESSPWWVVDAVGYGMDHFPKQYSQAFPTIEEDPSGVKQSRLKQAGWMADRWPRGTRVTGMSYTHHRIVAKLEPDERVSMLRDAVTATPPWSTRELVKRVEALEDAVTVEVTEATTCAADQPLTVDDLLPEWRERAVQSGPNYADGYLQALVDTASECCFAPGKWRA